MATCRSPATLMYTGMRECVHACMHACTCMHACAHLPLSRDARRLLPRRNATSLAGHREHTQYSLYRELLLRLVCTALGTGCRVQTELLLRLISMARHRRLRASTPAYRRACACVRALRACATRVCLHGAYTYTCTIHMHHIHMHIHMRDSCVSPWCTHGARMVHAWCMHDACMHGRARRGTPLLWQRHLLTY